MNYVLSGEFRVHVEACDEHDSCSVYTIPDVILVDDKTLLETELILAASDVTQLLKTGNSLFFM